MTVDGHTTGDPTMPAPPAESGRQTDRDEQVQEVHRTPPTPDKATILVVDGQPDNLSAVARQVAGHLPECRIITATGAREGLALALQDPPDVALIDAQMPHMDGIEMTRRLKGDDRTAHFPVILMTAHGASPALKAEGLRAGADDFIPRPIGNVELVARIRAALRIKRAEDERSTMLQTAMDGFWIIDSQGRFVDVNAAYCEMTGYSRDELLAMAIRDIEAVETPRETADHIKAVIASGAQRFETRHRRKDGQIIDVEVSTNYMASSEQLSVFIRDITEHKKLDEQFRQAQKMEAIGRLAGGVAHDFRNQLTVIKGYCGLLLRKLEQDNELREMVAEIDHATDRSARVTGQLLAFSRRQTLQPEVVELDRFLSDLHNPLSRMIGEDIHLSMAAAARVGNVKVDRSQLEQALMNLAVNARDAMPNGGKLTIETVDAVLGTSHAVLYADLRPGPYVVLVVSDTGIGMDAETCRHVFEPFFTTKETGRGTGLGLAMVYGFIRQSGGHIDVTSTPGQGTTFRLYLPVTRDPALETTAEAPRSDRVPTGCETVLVAEDDEAVRQIIVRSLRQNGYTVLEAGNAREALPLGKHYDGRIDLLISDVVMPGLNGPELAQRLENSRPAMKVLFVSGYPRNVTNQSGAMADDARFLPKPFTAAVLARAVRQVLDADSPGARDEQP